ncbi:PREDICTED: cytochrome b5-like isoform X2 [Nelumbo nucifera]|uniref:Cytochrome b5-like isoform X2 n=1 Tax=Nelumbo nucifera TaxID=4432 RepID=A0A1U8BKS6_NELNU|nr:PREDICTED: cytochrome b5-like isoform X2 [Nelumbo nucifera]
MEEPKVYSLSEISRHTSNKDCWVLIKGKVYDVTDFLEEHPGGEAALLEASAKGDATEDFEYVGHTIKAIRMMSKYCIGFLEGCDASQDTGISGTVKEENEWASLAAKSKHGKKPLVSMNLFEYLLAIFIFVVAFVAWYNLNKASS